jgi:peptidoglycan/LPS O-acetylase OafA/YrhL
MKRIPALDGWRGIAILLVLFDHIQDAVLHRYARPWTQTGQHGVTIFFVLSGFLITSKLLENPLQPADIRRFYIRRLFRLMPVAWTFLAVMFLFNHLVHAHFISLAEISACLLFYRNYAGSIGGGAAGHFWSLSLEEQFYLVWPILLMLAGIRRCRWIAAGGALACALFRSLFWAHYDRNLWNNQTQVRADALLVGCLLAWMISEPRIRVAVARGSKLLAIPAFATLLFCMACFHWLPPLTECVAIALLLAASVLYPGALFARMLAFGPLVGLGMVSYSLYVWQAFFMLLWSDNFLPWLLCMLMPVFILGSYYCIELPATRLGHKLTRQRPIADPECRPESGNSHPGHPVMSLPVQ